MTQMCAVWIPSRILLWIHPLKYRPKIVQPCIINIYFVDGLTDGIIWTENKETKELLAFSYEGESNKRRKSRKYEKIKTLPCSAADTSRHHHNEKGAHCMKHTGQGRKITKLYRKNKCINFAGKIFPKFSF